MWWERLRLAWAVLTGAEIIVTVTPESRHAMNLERAATLDVDHAGRYWMVEPDCTVWVPTYFPAGRRGRRPGIAPVSALVRRVTVVRW